ncbi:MAG: potassium/proton antiporter [Clostridia bacterium]|nr:potassium/proton antiporter [Clostridia bacterium]
MTWFLLLCTLVIFAGVLLYKVSDRFGFPVLLAFIFLGMLFGSDGLLRIPFEDYGFAEQICSVALIFIMFYGGFGTNFKRAKPVLGRSVLLSTLGVALTAVFTGLFCRLALGMDWAESFLLGSVMSSTDAASVFSVLRAKKLNLKYNTASLLEVESGSNDPCSYMLTVFFISVVNGNAAPGQMLYSVFAQIAYGAIGGFLIGLVASLLLRRIKFPAPGFDSVFVIGIAILSYAAPAALGGNGYLSAYIVGIFLGNSEMPNKKSLVYFFDGATSLVQMAVFFLLGLLSSPSKLPAIALPAILIALFLTLIARPAVIALLLSPFKCKINQQALVAFAGLRGASSIVFAIMAVMSVEAKHDLFHIVFFVVLFSIAIQGTLLPFVSKKLRMIDESGDVMKTFNDYSEEVDVRFVQFVLPEGHKWCGRRLCDVTFPPGTLAVLILREDAKIVPRGTTVLQAGDKVILSGDAAKQGEELNFAEVTIESEEEGVGKPLKDCPLTSKALVMMVKRKDLVIIPKGHLILRKGDVLVIHKGEAAKQEQRAALATEPSSGAL